MRCISGRNLVIVAWTGDKLLYGQAQNGTNLDLQVKFDIEDQDQSTPKIIGFLTVLRCISGPNLVILTYTSEKLSCRQAQNEVKFDFQVKFDLEGQGRSPPPKKNRHLNQGVLRLSSKFGDSSVNGWWVIVRTSKWLIHTHRHTDRHTDAGDDNTRRPQLASGKKSKCYPR